MLSRRSLLGGFLACIPLFNGSGTVKKVRFKKFGYILSGYYSYLSDGDKTFNNSYHPKCNFILYDDYYNKDGSCNLLLGYDKSYHIELQEPIWAYNINPNDFEIFTVKVI
jgi:hypothetical protein